MKFLPKTYNMATDLTIATTILCIATLISCGHVGSSDFEDDFEQDYYPENYDKFKDFYNQLKGTSWKLKSSFDYKYNSSGSLVSTTDNTVTNNSNKSTIEYFLTTIMTFTDIKEYDNPHDGYQLLLSTFPNYGIWYFNSDGSLTMNNSYNYNYGGAPTASQYGTFTRFWPVNGGVIKSLDSNTLEIHYIKEYEGTKFESRYIFSKTQYSGNSSDNTEPKEPSGYEQPEVGFYDFTATRTSVTVKYQLYNPSSCGKVNLAKIYYGTTSANRAVNATVAGNYITATISGLKSGTSYYVKAVVNSSGGSTTTSETKVITNY